MRLEALHPPARRHYQIHRVVQIRPKPIKTIMIMSKYVCDVCGYEYDPATGDPDNGIAPGTSFEDLPADWVCPICGVAKDQFSKE